MKLKRIVYLKAIAALGFFADNVKNRVDQFSSFSVVTFGPVVTGSTLAKDEIVRAEELAKWSRTNGIHGARLQIHKNSTGNIFASACFIVVDIDAFQLQFRLAVVGAIRLDSMLVRNDFPKLPEKVNKKRGRVRKTCPISMSF